MRSTPVAMGLVSAAFLRVLHQLRVETRAEAFGHETFDDASDFGLGIAFAVDETDRHALVWCAVAVDVGVVDDALDFTVDGEGLGAAWDEQLEEELGSYGKRATCLDEGATARDVL